MMHSQFKLVKYIRESATKTSFWLGPLLTLAGVFRGICLVDASVQFKGFTVLDRHVCPAEYAGIKTQVTSTTKCVLHCATTPSCRGVSFEEDTLKCIKCSTREFLEYDTTSVKLYQRQVVKNENEAGFGHFTYSLVVKPLDWDSTKVECESMGGYLASIESSDEQTYIANLVQSNHSRGVWIGGRGSAEDINSFQWTDGTVVSAGYSNWYNSKISDIVGRDCMQMTMITGYQWKNKACTETSFGVCKFG